MEVVSARSALLSNFEVLSLLQELDREHLALQKTAVRVKKEEDERLANGEPQNAALLSQLQQNEVCENLRTIELEAIQYLSADYQPTNSQMAIAITQLVRKLGQYDLTKAEKLQIVNLAPVEPVELYVIIEEIEDRFGDRMDEMLKLIRESLFTPSSSSSTTATAQPAPESTASALESGNDDYREGWDDGNDGGVEDEYDDTGAGAGIEGDLEMDEPDD